MSIKILIKKTMGIENRAEGVNSVLAKLLNNGIEKIISNSAITRAIVAIINDSLKN